MPVTYLNIKYEGVTIRGNIILKFFYSVFLFYLFSFSIWNAGTLFYKYISMLFNFLYQPENTRPANIYSFNNKNTRKRSEICPKFTVKTPKQRQ